MKISLHLLLMLCCCLINIKQGLGQEPYFVNLSKIMGLPSNSVYNMLQDSKGFLWVANNEGLTRYDGFEFKTYKCKEQKSTAGSYLKQDKYHRIWYQVFDGYIYYLENDSLKALEHGKPQALMPYGIVGDYLFVIGVNMVEIYNLNNLKLHKKIPLDLNLPQHTCEDKENFYILANNNLHVFDKNLKTNTISIPWDDIGLKDSHAQRFVYALNGEIILASKLNEINGLYRFNPKEQILERKFELPGVSFIQGIHWIDNKYWILTTKGCHIIDERGRSLTKQPYLAKSPLSYLMKDRQENYWFSSNFDGIFLIPNLDNQVLDLGLEGNEEWRRMTTDDKLLWLGSSRERLIALDSNLNVVEENRLNEKTNPIHLLYKDNNYLFYVSNKFYTIFKGKAEASYGSAIKDIHPVDDKYYAFAASSLSIGLFCSSDSLQNSVWDNFFNKYRHETFTRFATELREARAKCVSKHIKKELLYFGTNQGLFELSPKEDGLREIKQNGRSFMAQKLINWGDFLYALDAKGNLFEIDSKDNFRLLNQHLNIPEDGIKLLRKSDDLLFLLCRDAFRMYNLRSKTVDILGIDIDHTDLSDFAYFNGHLFLANKKQLIVLKNLDRRKIKNNPILALNKIQANKNEIDLQQKPRLSYWQNNISIHYSILNFGSFYPSLLCYRINEGEWQTLPNQSRSLEFPALAPGEYRLQFRWLDAEILDEEIYFEICAPFWKTWWFLLGILSLIGGLGYFYYQSQINFLLKQNILLQEKVQLEQELGRSMLTSIKSQMNPHFFFNALNSIQAFIFSQDTRKAGSYLAKFSKLTRMILEMSEQDTIKLSEELTALKLYLELENMRFDGELQINFEVDHQLDTEMIRIPSMIIQPYVENAIKHGLFHQKGPKHLLLAFHKINNNLQVIIDDNGIGRSKAEALHKIKQKKHESFSSRANAQRLELLNRGRNQKLGLDILDKFDDNGQACGTRISLIIPI